MIQKIQTIDFENALGERYLAYALSTITARSLPDVRDGLKPVHRRLLYAMLQLRLNPTTSFKKCARVVGDVMGKFHPHGDAAIYGAMVRLAQSFSVRYPLVDGQGNFGNIDGDNAAAMRYTEARLTDIAMLLAEGLDEDAVDFRATYDGESEEPMVFPAAFPHLLANGSEGIAVGMATSIPPHNLSEICGALIHLIDHPEASVHDLIAYMPAPDFPTGGILIESKDSIQKAYETGRGGFRLRARWSTETIKGGGYRVIITEIPYQVTKSKLIEKIATLLMEKKLPFLADIIDESADDVRIVLEPRSRTIEADVLMESLFKLTDLETRISLNMNVLDEGKKPRVMSLKQVLQAFLAHRQVVLQRRSQYRLKAVQDRLHLLVGYLIAYLNLDEVIHIIREYDEPKIALIERFQLSEIQVEAILNMRLRALRKLQETELRKEQAELLKEEEHLQELLGKTTLQWKHIKAELRQLIKKYGPETALGARRTTIAEPPTAMIIPIESVIEREDVTIICSAQGWIRSIKGHQVVADDIKYKEGDEGRHILKGQTTDKLVILSCNGRAYTIPVDKLPGGRGHGEPLRILADIENTVDVIRIITVSPQEYEKTSYLMLSTDGRGFLIKAGHLISNVKAGKQIMALPEGAKVKGCFSVTGDSIAIIGDNRKMLIFSIKDLPYLSRGRGVMLQKYRQGGVSDIQLFNRSDGLTWATSRGIKCEKELLTWEGRQGGIGRLAPTGFPQNNRFT